MFDFSIPDLDRQLDQLANVTNALEQAAILTAIGRRIGVAAESVVSEYPPQRREPLPRIYQRKRPDGSTYMSKFKSRKQQGYVFGVLIRERRIPYKRTGKLGQSITSAVQSVARDGVTVAIGTNLNYAPYVIGIPPTQSHYHQGNWTPLQEDIAEGFQRIKTEGAAEAARQISIYLGGK